MGLPVFGNNIGSGVDQVKSQIVGWIQEEIRASQRAGIGVPVDGSAGKLTQSIRASGVVAAVVLTSAAVATNGVITWGASVTPALTFNTPFSSALITVGALVTADSGIAGRSMIGHLGLSVNGATPSTDYQQWPYVSAANPTGGAVYTQNISMSLLVAVTPNVAQTVAAWHGFNTFTTAVAGMTATFSNRFITVVPIP